MARPSAALAEVPRATGRSDSMIAAGVSAEFSMPPPELEPGGCQPAKVLLMDRLAGDAERLGDLGPRPTGADCLFDGGVLEQVGHFAQRHHRGEAIGGSTERIG